MGEGAAVLFGLVELIQSHVEITKFFVLSEVFRSLNGYLFLFCLFFFLRFFTANNYTINTIFLQLQILSPNFYVGKAKSPLFCVFVF